MKTIGHRCSRIRIQTTVAAVPLLLAGIASAQQVGHYIQGAAGLTGGSLAPPGYYFSYLPYIYDVQSIKGPNGRSVVNQTDFRVSAHNLVLTAVAKTKFLGADYGFSVIVPIAKQRIAADILPTGSFSKYGVSDIYFSPIQLGWHRTKFDILFNYGFYAPTGDYSADNTFNVGLGFWTHQFQLGTTYYFDKTKKWNASVLSTWEIHTAKVGIDVKPGPGMTLEYGLGRRMFSYRLNVGVAGSYYRKLFLDSGTGVTRAFHDQENSIGPEITYIAPKAHMAFMFRYEPQFQVRSRTSGQIFVASVTYLGTNH